MHLEIFADQQGSGIATAGVFTYFFWVLLQPFRGNPEYRDVADLPYNSTCLTEIQTSHTDMTSLSKPFPECKYCHKKYAIICFSACGGMRTGRNMSVLLFFPCWLWASWERVDSSWRGTTSRRLRCWTKGLFYPSWNRLQR